jgi:hypothetical protein
MNLKSHLRLQKKIDQEKDILKRKVMTVKERGYSDISEFIANVRVAVVKYITYSY